MQYLSRHFEVDTQLSGVAALDHGQHTEAAAAEDYVHAMQPLSHNGLEVFRFGLCLHSSYV